VKPRKFLLLVGAGLSLVLVSIPLWRVTRAADCSGRGQIELQPHGGAPCDPRLYLPFGDLALGLVILGGIALLVAAGLLIVWGFQRVRALDRSTSP
jgi:hypothetical protein